MNIRRTQKTAGNRQFMPDARKAYEHGASMRTLRLRFHMSESELEDCCPEEFEDVAPEPDNAVGGY